MDINYYIYYLHACYRDILEINFFDLRFIYWPFSAASNPCIYIICGAQIAGVNGKRSLQQIEKQ